MVSVFVSTDVSSITTSVATVLAICRGFECDNHVASTKVTKA